MYLAFRDLVWWAVVELEDFNVCAYVRNARLMKGVTETGRIQHEYVHLKFTICTH